MSLLINDPDTDYRPVKPGAAQARRDPLVDLVRAGALLIVVVWHWVFTSIRWADDGPHVGNPVAATPGLWLATWFLQAMPAFFIVGGYLHHISLSGSESPQWRRFWVHRTRRLVAPVLPLVIAAGALALLFGVVGRPDLVRGVILIMSPMWFLATYLVCVALAPLAAALHKRFGVGVVIFGVGVVALVDWMRIGLGIGGTLTGALAFVAVWATVHQIGFSLGRIRAADRRTQVTVTLAGYTGMAVVAALLPHPAAMVGLDGHKLSNMGPPTIMVVLLAIGQIGLLSLIGPTAERFAQTHRRLLETMGRWSMTVYAWHLSAYAMFWFIAIRSGLNVSSRIDGQWWLQRPLWLLGPLVLAIPICRITRRFDSILA